MKTEISKSRKENGSVETITVDDKEYKLSEISEAAKGQISNVQFVDQQIRQLKNEWAVADTARLGYRAALKGELNKTTKK
jgi:cell division protein ZapA (FtsZ GTPase activity inhibitor)